VRTADGTLRDVTLLPLFDDAGSVRGLMLFDHDRAMVSVQDWRPDLVRVPWRGAVRLDASVGSLGPVSGYQASQAAQLWHFDPDWLLREKRCADDPACVRLTANNCAGRWPVRSLYFRRDLSRITMVSITQAGGIQIGRWKSKLLPPRVAVAAPAFQNAARSGRRIWILDPIWQG